MATKWLQSNTPTENERKINNFKKKRRKIEEDLLRNEDYAK